jgi:hypothetical protein
VSSSLRPIPPGRRGAPCIPEVPKNVAVVYHDDQTRVISLQRDFDHILIAETGMEKRVGNELGYNELSIGPDGLRNIIDRPHPQTRFPHRPYIAGKRKPDTAHSQPLASSRR